SAIPKRRPTRKSAARRSTPAWACRESRRPGSSRPCAIRHDRCGAASRRAASASAGAAALARTGDRSFDIRLARAALLDSAALLLRDQSPLLRGAGGSGGHAFLRRLQRAMDDLDQALPRVVPVARLIAETA